MIVHAYPDAFAWLPCRHYNTIIILCDYRSLMPMAMEVRKPIFFLKAADGAIGAHIEAVQSAYDDFQKLAAKIATFAEIAFPYQH